MSLSEDAIIGIAISEMIWGSFFAPFYKKCLPPIQKCAAAFAIE